MQGQEAPGDLVNLNAARLPIEVARESQRCPEFLKLPGSRFQGLGFWVHVQDVASLSLQVNVWTELKLGWCS